MRNSYATGIVHGLVIAGLLFAVGWYAQPKYLWKLDQKPTICGGDQCIHPPIYDYTPPND